MASIAQSLLAIEAQVIYTGDVYSQRLARMFDIYILKQMFTHMTFQNPYHYEVFVVKKTIT